MFAVLLYVCLLPFMVNKGVYNKTSLSVLTINIIYNDKLLPFRTVSLTAGIRVVASLQLSINAPFNRILLLLWAPAQRKRATMLYFAFAGTMATYNNLTARGRLGRSAAPTLYSGIPSISL